MLHKVYLFIPDGVHVSWNVSAAAPRSNYDAKTNRKLDSLCYNSKHFQYQTNNYCHVGSLYFNHVSVS